MVKRCLIQITAFILIIAINFVLAIPEFHSFGAKSIVNGDSIESFSYDFSSHVKTDDNDQYDNIISYSIIDVHPIDPNVQNQDWINWFVVNESTGILIIDTNNYLRPGEYRLSVLVENRKSLGESRPFYFELNLTEEEILLFAPENELNFLQRIIIKIKRLISRIF